MISAIVFDFGGVLCKLIDRQYRRKWEKKLSLSEGELEKIIFESRIAQHSLRGDKSEEDVWEWTKSYFGLDKIQVFELQNDFWEGHEVDIDLYNLCLILKSRYKLGIISNFWKDGRSKIVNHFKLNIHIFNSTIISSEHKILKPNKSIYRLSSKELITPLNEILFIDDEERNVKGALNAGMKALRFQSASALVEHMKGMDLL